MFYNLILNSEQCYYIKKSEMTKAEKGNCLIPSIDYRSAKLIKNLINFNIQLLLREYPGITNMKNARKAVILRIRDQIQDIETYNLQKVAL